jgi:hypothetical protein
VSTYGLEIVYDDAILFEKTDTKVFVKLLVIVNVPLLADVTFPPVNIGVIITLEPYVIDDDDNNRVILTSVVMIIKPLEYSPDI